MVGKTEMSSVRVGVVCPTGWPTLCWMFSPVQHKEACIVIFLKLSSQTNQMNLTDSSCDQPYSRSEDGETECICPGFLTYVCGMHCSAILRQLHPWDGCDKNPLWVNFTHMFWLSWWSLKELVWCPTLLSRRGFTVRNLAPLSGFQ